MFQREDPVLTCKTRLQFFLAAHWQGVVLIAVPSILAPFLLIPPIPQWKWCAFTLILMACYWVTECIPLAVTSFFPVLIFPMTGVMSTSQTCGCYINDTVLMFLGSLMLAYAVEQSGLHRRLAYTVIRTIGYSHQKLLLAMCCVTTFISMWITNTAATTMMVPINFALLKVFEDQGLLRMYEYAPDGSKIASDITSCYFCSATFSATIGGVGTLVGTATNLAFKGLFMTAYPKAPEYLSFPLFSAFGTPLMIVLEILVYLYLSIVYLGMFRGNSEVAKATQISAAGKAAAKRVIDADWVKIGKLRFWELMVVILFGGAMLGFFSRSPQVFHGWGDMISVYFQTEDKIFVKDSALAALVSFLMFLLPSTLDFFKNFKSKFYEDMPKKAIPSVLIWKRMNAVMPFSFMFLLGGGFALSRAASTSGLNNKIGEKLQGLKSMDNMLVLLIIILCVIFVTNFASNVVVCNVFVPITMQLAKVINKNPLWYNIAAGFTASFCFMLPVGTPGNLIVQCAANIPTTKMMKAGAGPTLITVIVTWLFVYFYAPIVWPDLKKMPDWTT